MRPAEHIDLTGHVGFTPFTEAIVDWLGICDECYAPLTDTPLVSDERTFKGAAEWLRAIEAEHYANNVELRMNGCDPDRPFGLRGVYEEYSTLGSAHEPEADRPADA